MQNEEGVQAWRIQNCIPFQCDSRQNTGIGLSSYLPPLHAVREPLLAVLDKCCKSCLGDCLSWCLLCCWAFRTGTTIFSSFLQTQPCTSVPELTLFFQHVSQCAEQTQQYFPRFKILFFFQDSQHPKHGIIEQSYFLYTF